MWCIFPCHFHSMNTFCEQQQNHMRKYGYILSLANSLHFHFAFLCVTFCKSLAFFCLYECNAFVLAAVSKAFLCFSFFFYYRSYESEANELNDCSFIFLIASDDRCYLFARWHRIATPIDLKSENAANQPQTKFSALKTNAFGVYLFYMPIGRTTS